MWEGKGSKGCPDPRDSLPRDSRHHQQVHQVVRGAVPVADDVAVRRVQVRLALGNVHLEKDTVLRATITIQQERQVTSSGE